MEYSSFENNDYGRVIMPKMYWVHTEEMPHPFLVNPDHIECIRPIPNTDKCVMFTIRGAVGTFNVPYFKMCEHLGIEIEGMLSSFEILLNKEEALT